MESTISTKPLWKQLPKAARTCLALRLVEHLDLGTQEEAEGSEAVRTAALGHIKAFYSKYYIHSETSPGSVFTLRDLFPTTEHASISVPALKKLSDNFTTV